MSSPQDRGARRAEFERIALPLAPALRATARRLARHAETADDLVQETFLRAYRTFDSFVSGTNVRAWLFTILYSIHSNAAQKRWTARGTVSMDEMEARFERGLDFPDPHAHRAVLDNSRLVWEGSEAERALAALPEGFRAAVTLVDLDEFSYEEAAEILACPVGTLRSRLFRGRKVLAVALADWARRSGRKAAAD